MLGTVPLVNRLLVRFVLQSAADRSPLVCHFEGAYTMP